MSEKIAHWATAVSAVISAIVLVISIFKYWGDTDKEKVSDWQKVVVYEIILKNKDNNFNAIKIGYVTESQQITTFDIPREQIQNDSLMKVLLELQESRLINLTDKGLYVPVLAYIQKNPSEYMAQMISMLQSEKQNSELYPVVKTKILDVIKNDCGKYDQGTLYRAVSEKIEVDAPMFYNILHRMRGNEVHLLDDNTWCATYDSERVETDT